MNSSIYIFGNMQQGYTQYPDDETTHEIFQRFLQNATAPTQLTIHRDGPLVYYGYIRKLKDEQFIGLCALINNVLMTDPSALFDIFERTMEQLAEAGYLIKFATDGTLIGNTDHLYMSKTEVETVGEWLKQSFEQHEGTAAALPPVDYSRGIDYFGRFNFTDDATKIVESIHSNAYTIVRKQKGFNTSTMDSYQGVLAAVNNENETLKKQIEQLQAVQQQSISTSKANKKSDGSIMRAILLVFVIIGLVAAVFAFIKVKNNNQIESASYSQNDSYDDNSTSQKPQRRTFNDLLDQGYVYLQGHISEAPVSMYLKFYQNEEGYEYMRDDIVFGILHYDNQPANAILMVKGNFTRDGSITLREFDGNRHSGDIHGTLDGYSFDGEHVTSNLAFVASVQDNPKIPATYEKLTDFLFSEEYFDDAGNNTIIAFTDKNVYYIEGSYIDGVSIFDHDCGMGHIYNLTIEDLSKETENKIPIQNTSECWYEIKGVMCTNHRITFILEDRGRNSIGSSNYSTQVTQYNIDTGKWKIIAKEMASAEFVNQGTKIKVLQGYVTNQDEVYSTYDYEWAYEEYTIDL